MPTFKDRFLEIKTHFETASLHIRTLGTFEATQGDRIISGQSWGREKTIQLLQFLITNRSRKGLHKEQIINRLWEDSDEKDGDRDFKVALHGINKALEPNRQPRTDPSYVIRQGSTYQLNNQKIWIDGDSLEAYIALGNETMSSDAKLSAQAFREAVNLHHGIYLPNRVYEDWTSEERERLQVLILSAYLSLAELVMNENPLEAVQLTQKALSIDKTWEDAYQIQMRAYLIKGNRPAAIKTYHHCVKVLDKEFGLDPLPETQELYDSIA